MPDIANLIQNGTYNLWIFIPSAILLGALHGLEPGHSKTMMAAFIIAVRGTVSQAALLGIATTISHTAVVWVVAFAGIYFIGDKFDAETTEPYFHIASGILIVAIAIWVLYRTWKHQQGFKKFHSHHPSSKELSTVIPEEYQDAHELAHAKEIKERFVGQSTTTGQIIMFGLTGGLLPCPASITVLLLCLQLKKIALGALLVTCFSIGLALTMVAAGAIASLSLNQAKKRWSGFSVIAARAPYLSGALIIIIGIYMTISGVYHVN